MTEQANDGLSWLTTLLDLVDEDDFAAADADVLRRFEQDLREIAEKISR